MVMLSLGRVWIYRLGGMEIIAGEILYIDNTPLSSWPRPSGPSQARQMLYSHPAESFLFSPLT